MTFGPYHIFLLFLVGNFSKISMYILTYYFVDKYFQSTFLDALTKRSSFLSISNILLLVVSLDVIVSFITLCLYFYDIHDRHKIKKIRIEPGGDGEESFKILIGIREKKKESGKKDKNILDKLKIHRKEFNKYILTINKADKKLACKLNFALTFDTD